MASVLDAVKYYQQSIEKHPNDEEKVLKCIDKLFHLDVTTQHLQETGVGRTVNALRKDPGEVGTAARSLVYKWKRMVAAEESDHEGDPRTDSSMHNGNGSGKESDDNSRQHKSRHEQYERSTTKPSHTQHRQINGHSTENKRKYHSSEEEEPNTKKKRHSISDDDHKRTVIVKQEKVSDSESDDDSDSSESDSDSYTSGSSREGTKHRNDRQEVKIKEEPESPERHKSSKNHHSHHQDHRRESSSKQLQEPEKKTNHSSKSKDSPRLTSESSKSSSHKHKSSHDRENSSDKKHKSDNKLPEEKRESKESNRHNSLERQKSSGHKQDHSLEKYKSSSDSHSSKSDRHRSSDKESDKHRSSDKVSDKHRSSEKESDKHRSSSQTDKESDKPRSSSLTDKESDRHKSSSHSDKDSDKHKSSSDRDSSKHRSKESSGSSSKDKHSSSNTEKSKDRSSSSSKDKSSSHNEKKHSSSDSKLQEKTKHERSEDRSEKKSKDKSSSSSHKSKSKSKDEIPKKKSKKSNSEENEEGIDCGSGASFAEALGMMISPTKSKKKSYKDLSPSNSFCNDLSPAALLAPTAKLAPLPSLEISALPEISPNYKPRPPPKPLPHFSDEDAISAGISSKNQRTKVYSGNKVLGKVTSLYAMCVTVLQEHIDALEYTGGVPYDILKPVIDKATPSQLFVLEHYNPYLMEDTDHLWQKNCEKNFRNKKRQEMETWRDMYLRCQEEQESKLKSLTANIRMTQEAKKAPIKQTKMAYVDNFVKPPRNIARKQAIHGTAHSATASPAARVASLASGPNVLKGGPRPPNAAPVSSTSFNRPKKAPLMQKALQFMRGRKR